jgi:hypothetical protein
MKAEHTRREIENGFRQFDRCLDIVEYYLDPERPFALRPHIIQELQKEAVEGIESQAGQLRTATVGISKSEHTPPPPHLVEGLVRDLCEYINDNWHEKNAFHLAAYAMWRLNCATVYQARLCTSGISDHPATDRRRQNSLYFGP